MSSGQIPRVPSAFPRMKWRARARVMARPHLMWQAPYGLTVPLNYELGVSGAEVVYAWMDEAAYATMSRQAGPWGFHYTQNDRTDQEE